MCKNVIYIFLDCPGTENENAGKVSACAGCPNQQICASGAARGPDPAVQIIKDRLDQIKNKLLILSGKGGVGKSTLTALLSRALAADDANLNVSPLSHVYFMLSVVCAYCCVLFGFDRIVMHVLILFLITFELCTYVWLVKVLK